jgi:hypothetical protein
MQTKLEAIAEAIHPHGFYKSAAYLHSTVVGIQKMEQSNNDLKKINVKLKARVEELESLHRWIPVEEGLPEDGQEVLALADMTAVEGFVEDDLVSGRKLWWYDCQTTAVTERLRNVTHWKPLPPVPEEE